MNSFTIGINDNEQLTLTVLDYERSPVGDFFDDNWLICEVSIRAGAFRGKFRANLLTSELEELHRELRILHDGLQGNYTFEPLEGQLILRISCNNLGHFQINGEAMDQAGIGHRLVFKFSLDQTYLCTALEELSNLIQAFPVRT
ncbi:WapI family immunity protein [Pseudomonas delhiensis]|uniref:WapI family immunity protein n=1 Tax=Pseudomonas delhiensis TaxID=366289 RepID=UPI00315A1FB3